MNLFGWDLPPGVRTCDLPGNRPEDIAWERACELAYEELEEELDREPTDPEVEERATEIFENL